MDNRVITGHTDVYCLIGSPVAHSISPEMHNASFAALGIDARYVAFDVKLSDMEVAVDGMRKLGIRGWNITMPGKNRMRELCDEVSLASEISGACNTVKNIEGHLYGTTTDGTGWVESARAAGHDPVGKRIVQMGAGGAGTSVLVQMALDGAESVDVFNDRDDFWPRAEGIVDLLNEKTGCQVCIHELGDRRQLKASLESADILLNTTPVGMKRMPGCLIPDPSYLHSGLTVSDVIYEPRQTPLLRMAEAAGCDTFNGMYMLLYQGAASFQLWTDREMPVEEIKSRYFNTDIFNGDKTAVKQKHK